ncbi:MAG TPA: sodium:proton antiporter NhaD, partial [Bacteroidales bacterium]|nr:sodium:proton antiporter NhaD [Bacteroidales bacterium]
MDLLILLIFAAGYLAIAFEQQIRINRAASAMIAGVGCWAVLILGTAAKETVTGPLIHHFSDVSGILFFLLCAMVIVELMDSHDSFSFIAQRIHVKSKRSLLWVISLLTFFLSSVLNNLTTTIVMLSLARKLVRNPSDRLLFAGLIIIASNAGGAWTPIGDVTTTMLWIGNQVSAPRILSALILPSLICLLIPLTIATFMIRNEAVDPEASGNAGKGRTTPFERTFIFFTGLAGLLSVPVFQALTQLPPYMGMILSLGLIWAITEIIHRKKSEEELDRLSVATAIRKTDVPTILFFLGILLAVSALDVAGTLNDCAVFLDRTVRSQGAVAVLLGLTSAVIDNVPLVAAAQGMYPLSVFPTNHYFWEFVAYTAGTGGSILVIGSASGIAAMGIEKITFFGYIRKISVIALAGYFA